MRICVYHMPSDPSATVINTNMALRITFGVMLNQVAVLQMIAYGTTVVYGRHGIERQGKNLIVWKRHNQRVRIRSGMAAAPSLPLRILAMWTTVTSALTGAPDSTVRSALHANCLGCITSSILDCTDIDRLLFICQSTTVSRGAGEVSIRLSLPGCMHGTTMMESQVLTPRNFHCVNLRAR